MGQEKRVDFKGKKNPFYGKSHSEESKQKMRYSENEIVMEIKNGF